MARPVKVGLIGLGFMGKMHFGCHKSSKRSKIVAIADVDQKKLSGDWSSIGGNIADANAKPVDLRGIKRYKKAQDLIDDPDVEMVDITLPTNMHAKWAIAALEAGKHVLCEKPIDRSLKEAEKFVKAAKQAAKNEQMAMVAHCIRFWPEYAVVKSIVEKEKYGKVLSASFKRVSPAPTWGWKNWLMNGKMSGGALLDLHIHDIDYVQYLFGKPKAVYARGFLSKMSTGGVDHVVANYTYGGVKQVMAEGAWGLEPAFPFEMSFLIVCEGATLKLTTADSPMLNIYLPKGKVESPQVPAGDGYSREIDYFLKCIQTGKPPEIVTVQDALNSVKIAEAELKSIKTGKLVTL